jgi:hypothetical protein
MRSTPAKLTIYQMQKFLIYLDNDNFLTVNNQQLDQFSYQES